MVYASDDITIECTQCNWGYKMNGDTCVEIVPNCEYYTPFAETNVETDLETCYQCIKGFTLVYSIN